MDSVVYTSGPVCNRIADRSVAEMTDASMAASKIVADLITPYAIQLYKVRRLPRGALKTVANQVVRALSVREAVFDVKVSTVAPALSTNEAYHIGFILGMQSGSGWATFMTSEILLNRKEFTMALTPCDFRINPHAIARYMQRELQPPRQFFEKVIESLRCANVLGQVRRVHESENFALPMGSGLLLGQCALVDGKERPPKTYRTRLGGKNKPTMHAVDRDRPVRPIIDIKTYVDDQAMTEPRERLHARLAAFSRDHDAALRRMFAGTMFEHAPEGEADIDAEIHAAVAAGLELIHSPEWDYFTRTVGT